MQLDQTYLQMQLFKQDETLSPWQSPVQNLHLPFMTVLDQQYTNGSITQCSLSPSPSQKVCKPKQKSKLNLLQTNRVKQQSLSRWNSASNIKIKPKTAKQSQSSRNLKNQLKKYHFNEELSTKASHIMNTVNFTPLNIAKMDNFSSIRSVSARTQRNKKTNKIQIKGISCRQKSPGRVLFQQQSYISEKTKVAIKQMMNRQWEGSNSMRLNLNKYINNYMSQEVKLRPVCLKLKLNK